MKLKITLITLLLNIFLLGQEKIETLKSGVLILKNDEKIPFSNLKYEGEKVFYINANTRQSEELFVQSIASIEEGLELSETEAQLLAIQNLQLASGVYTKYEDLMEGNPTNSAHQIIAKNTKKGFYYLMDSKNKKVGNIFAFVDNGILYVRPSAIYPHLSNKSSLRFTRNKYFFVKMNQSGDRFSANAPFVNNTVAMIGAIASGATAGSLMPGIGQAMVVGAAGASVIYLLSTTNKTILIDFNEKNMSLH